MKKNPAYFLPLLCFVVILATTIFAVSPRSSLKLSSALGLPKPTTSPLISSFDTKAVFNFSPSELSLVKGEEQTVAFSLLLPRQISLDGVNVILAFDPQKVVVTKVVSEKAFSFSSVNQDPVLGEISLTFLEEKGNGVALSGQVKLAEITLKPKTSGSSEIAVVEAEKGPSSVITQTKTSKKLAFSTMKLTLLTAD